MPHIPISKNGYSLIEMMIVIAVVAVLAGLAIPSFSSVIKNSQITSDYNSLSSSLTLARSEAIKRTENVSVCAMASKEVCGTDWSNGWLVFSDEGPTQGVFDSGEEIIKRVAIDTPLQTFTNRGRLRAGAASPAEHSFITFGPRGASNWLGTGYFVLCDDRGVDEARVANVTLSGDVRKARRDASDALISVFGTPATC